MLFRLQYLCQAHWFRRYLQSKFVVDAIWFLWPFLVLAKSTYSKGNLCVKQPKEERDLLCCKDAGDWIFVWNLTQPSVTLEWYLDKQFKRCLSDLRFSFKLSFFFFLTGSQAVAQGSRLGRWAQLTLWRVKLFVVGSPRHAIHLYHRIKQCINLDGGKKHNIKCIIINDLKR